MRFKDQVAIVAGGAGGIGREVSIQLANEGAKVIVWDLKQEALDDVVNVITSNGNHVETGSVNVMNYAEVKSAVQNVVDAYGRVDIMVSCVGGGTFKPLKDVDETFWKQQLDYNLNTVFNCFSNALEHMIQQKYGRLFCYMSTTGGTPGLACYGVAKAGVRAYMESIHAEHSRDHITVNAILPSFTPTPFSMQAFQGEEGKARFDAIAARMPLGPNTPENVAATTLDMLASERISNQIIHLM